MKTSTMTSLIFKMDDLFNLGPNHSPFVQCIKADSIISFFPLDSDDSLSWSLNSGRRNFHLQIFKRYWAPAWKSKHQMLAVTSQMKSSILNRVEEEIYKFTNAFFVQLQRPWWNYYSAITDVFIAKKVKESQNELRLMFIHPSLLEVT